MLLIAEQAPCRFACDAPPISTYSPAPIGTRLRSFNSAGPIVRPIGTNSVTQKPIYPQPISAGPHCGHVPTTSKQNGAFPAPIPPVGIVSPKTNFSCVDSPNVAPRSSSFSGFALFAGVILLLWFLAGASIRRFV